MAELWDIDHETGDLSQYDSTVTDGGDLSVTAAAALAGTGYGLQCFIDDGFAIYGQKNQGDTGTGKLRFRYYFNRNTLTLLAPSYGTMMNWYVAGAPFHVVRIWFLRTAAGAYQVYIEFYNDAGFHSSDQVGITGEHYIEVYIQQASDAVAADGSHEWWLDGVSLKSWANVDNYDIFSNMNYCRLGAPAVPFGAAGTYYLDQLKANDDGSEIGQHIEAAGRQSRPGFMKIEGAERFRSLMQNAIY